MSKKVIELPCNVGDKVYCIIPQGRFGTLCTTGEAIPRFVDEVIWNGKGFRIHCERIGEGRDNDCNFYGDWCDTVFATKEEAEARIEFFRMLYGLGG